MRFSSLNKIKSKGISFCLLNGVNMQYGILYPECQVSVDGRFRTVYSERLLHGPFSIGGG